MSADPRFHGGNSPMLAVYRPHGFFSRIPTGDIAAVPSRQQTDKGEVSYPAALLSEIVRQTRPLRLRSSARFRGSNHIGPSFRGAAKRRARNP